MCFKSKNLVVIKDIYHEAKGKREKCTINNDRLSKSIVIRRFTTVHHKHWMCTHIHTYTQYTQLTVESVTPALMCFLLTALSGRMLTEGPAVLSSCILLLHGASSQPLTFLFTALYIVKIMYEVSQPKPLHCVVLYTTEVCVCVCFSCIKHGFVQKKKKMLDGKRQKKKLFSKN